MGSKNILLKALKHHVKLLLLITDILIIWGKILAQLISRRYLVQFQSLVLTSHTKPVDSRNSVNSILSALAMARLQSRFQDSVIPMGSTDYLASQAQVPGPLNLFY